MTIHWHYFGNEISTLVTKLGSFYDMKSVNNNLKIFCDFRQDIAISTITSEILDHLVDNIENNRASNPTMPPSISICSLVVADLNFCHGTTRCYKTVEHATARYLKYLTVREIEYVVKNFWC